MPFIDFFYQLLEGTLQDEALSHEIEEAEHKLESDYEKALQKIKEQALNKVKEKTSQKIKKDYAEKSKILIDFVMREADKQPTSCINFKQT